MADTLCGKNYVIEGQKDSVLYNIGNKEIVECMADCKSVWKLIQKAKAIRVFILIL